MNCRACRRIGCRDNGITATVWPRFAVSLGSTNDLDVPKTLLLASLKPSATSGENLKFTIKRHDDNRSIFRCWRTAARVGFACSLDFARSSDTVKCRQDLDDRDRRPLLRMSSAYPLDADRSGEHAAMRPVTRGGAGAGNVEGPTGLEACRPPIAGASYPCDVALGPRMWVCALRIVDAKRRELR